MLHTLVLCHLGEAFSLQLLTLHSSFPGVLDRKYSPDACKRLIERLRLVQVRWTI